MASADHLVEAPAVLKTTRPTPLQAVGHAAVTIGLLVLILGVLFPRLSDADSAGDAFAQVSIAGLGLITALFFVSELFKAGPYVVLVPRMRVSQSFVANEASSTISNTIPGPSGTAATYLMFRSWGFDADAFGKATIVNSVWNNAVILLFPAVAMLLYGPTNDVDGYGAIIGLVGVVIAVIGAVVIFGMIRSVAFSHRVGVLCGRVVTWARGIIGRPRPADFGDAVVRFRADVMDTVKTRWHALTLVIVGKYLMGALLLGVCLRAVGVGENILDWREILVGYAVVRLLTVIQITPGGVGVTELAYAAVLQSLAGDVGSGLDSAIVAGTLLFRAFTYVGPILVGIPCYLVWRMKKSWKTDVAEVRDDPAGFATAGFRSA